MATRMFPFDYSKLLYSFLIVSFLINPFIYMGNLSRHDNLPAYPVVIFNTHPASLHALNEIFAQLRVHSPIPRLEQTTAKYETTIPDISALLINSLKSSLCQATFAFNLWQNTPFWGILAAFSLSGRLIDLPLPDKPPTHLF